MELEVRSYGQKFLTMYFILCFFQKVAFRHNSRYHAYAIYFFLKIMNIGYLIIVTPLSPVYQVYCNCNVSKPRKTPKHIYRNDKFLPKHRMPILSSL